MNPRRLLLVRPLINIETNSPFFLPLGLLCLASAARQAGHIVHIVDFEFLHRTRERYTPTEPLATFVRQIMAAEPDVVGITVLADTLPTAIVMGRALKVAMPSLKVVLGGPGTFGTVGTLKKDFADSLDLACMGEGELALSDFLNSSLIGEDAIAGMVRVDGAPLSATDGPAPLANPDSLPPPAYDLVDVSEYLRLASPRVFDLYVGSGCTYACTFCTTAPFWSRTFRAKSPARILAEMTHLDAAFGIRQFNFVHDNFGNSKAYLNGFLDHFEVNNSAYSWGCAVRPDNVTRATLERMRKAGCEFVFTGTDSGSPQVLRAMRKATSTHRSYALFEDARLAGIQLETNTIIGYPNESDAGLEASLAIVFDAIANGARTADVSVLQPLPGSPVATAYEKDIQPVSSNFLGTYLPKEAEELVRDRLDVFCGFGFIRRNNRAYEDCTKIAEMVRYFTRHYVRSVLFLNRILGIRYLDVFDRLKTIAIDEMGQNFCAVARALARGSDSEHLFDAILQFDSASESLRNVDVVAEVINVYSAPPRMGPAVTYTSISTKFPVHEVFADRPAIQVVPQATKPITYVFSCAQDVREIVTVALRGWQRVLWERFEQERYDEGDSAAHVAALQFLRDEQPGVGAPEADAAVRRIIHTFRQLTGRSMFTQD